MKWLYYLMPVCIVIFACILTGKSIISGNMVFAEERVTGTVRSVEDINSKKR